MTRLDPSRWIHDWIRLYYNPSACLPSAEELPDSDDTPVDNELQDLIPGLLKALLAVV